MLTILLSDEGKGAKKIKSEFKSVFPSKEEYFEYIDKIFTSGDRIKYSEDSAKVEL